MSSKDDSRILIGIGFGTPKDRQADDYQRSSRNERRDDRDRRPEVRSDSSREGFATPRKGGHFKPSL